MYIAIDTSTETASLALVRDDSILAELTWHCGQNHTIQLLPALSSLLNQVGLSTDEAKGIIVARGPGSYNGLRVGLSTAKGLAFSLGIPLVGISTLEAEAYQCRERAMPVCTVMNAGRGEIAAAVYESHGGNWTQIIAEHITSLEVLCTRINSPTIFCGEYVPIILPELKNRLGDKALFVSTARLLRRAGYLAELGIRRLRSSDYDDPVTLQPLYLRAPPITQPKSRS
jgi:tRNA threonylcarbamoyl adenosine modification protein YeaZ